MHRLSRIAIWRNASRLKSVQQASELVDDLKMQIKLAREFKVFLDFSQFQRVAELAVCLGRRAGVGSSRSGRATDVAIALQRVYTCMIGNCWIIS